MLSHTAEQLMCHAVKQGATQGSVHNSPLKRLHTWAPRYDAPNFFLTALRIILFEACKVLKRGGVLPAIYPVVASWG